MKTQQTATTLLLILLLLANCPAIAQIGIKAGAGISDIVFADEGQKPYLGYETDYLTHRYPAFSYQLAVFGTLHLGNRFDFQPELAFAKRGLNYNIGFLHDQVVYKLDIWYVQMPLIFTYSFRPDKKMRPVLLLGPYGSLTLSAKKVTEYDGIPKTENTNNVKPYDFGLLGGIGFDIDMGRGQLVTELRAGYSLVDMMKPVGGHIPEYDTPENLKARNVNLAVTLGYRFDFSNPKTDAQ